MRALITNDDGIGAPGIRALASAVAPMFDEVMVVAPLTGQSSTGHGVTFGEPLMTRRVAVELPEASARGTGEGPGVGVAVDGRPADCTKLALTELWPERFGAGSRPDVVLSGLNMGANIGINVLYSGTVAAAIEAAFLGVPAVALSLHLGRGVADYPRAAGRARAVLERVFASGPLDRHACLNVNIARCELGEPEPEGGPPLVVCPMNVHAMVDRYERRESPGGAVYYWPAGGGLEFHGADAGTDVERLLSRCCTLTPLRYDLTESEAALAVWRGRLGA